ncbi:MAG: NUDIX domain-containing protein [Pseudomonadota bacterium]|nr:NUDIX domain-containing protein [Pseudomonadota bacterium]
MQSIAIALIKNTAGEILVTQRPEGRHLSGFWEFPGGKIEPNETVQQALKRELKEELGLEIKPQRELIRLPYTYSKKGKEPLNLVFHCWLCVITKSEGQPIALNEGQAFARWYTPDALSIDQFPPANRGMLRALQLPKLYYITQNTDSASQLIAQLQHFEMQMPRNICEPVLLQLRQKTMLPAFDQVIAELERIKKRFPALVIMLNFTTAQNLADVPNCISGLHLTAEALRQITDKSQIAQMAGFSRFTPRWIFASCHDEESIEKANALGLDGVTLSPVCRDKGQSALGWQRFEELVMRAQMPVYALGGLSPSDVSLAQQHLAQGIAGIGFWQPEAY